MVLGCGSAIGADLLQLMRYLSVVPVFVQRNTASGARGPETLVIASSHSGRTEETLALFNEAAHKGCRLLAVCTGGKLAEMAVEMDIPLWKFDHRGQPRAAVGFSFGLLLAAFTRLALLPDPTHELANAVAAMRTQQESLVASVSVVQNLAKRTAGQLMGRWVAVFGADILEPVARRWKGQISEVSKAWAQFEFLPEADHNTVAGVVNPEPLLSKTMALFLRAPSYYPRNRLRADLTKKILMLEGLNTDFIDASGDTPLAHQWTALHLGDYTAYYLAMAYGVDPTPVAAIEGLKREMAGS
jgi:glucose/mannose-6-phosphate isomerase